MATIRPSLSELMGPIAPVPMGLVPVPLVLKVTTLPVQSKTPDEHFDGKAKRDLGERVEAKEILFEVSWVKVYTELDKYFPTRTFPKPSPDRAYEPLPLTGSPK